MQHFAVCNSMSRTVYHARASPHSSRRHIGHTQARRQGHTGVACMSDTRSGHTSCNACFGVLVQHLCRPCTMAPVSWAATLSRLEQHGRVQHTHYTASRDLAPDRCMAPSACVPRTLCWGPRGPGTSLLAACDSSLTQRDTIQRAGSKSLA